MTNFAWHRTKVQRLKFLLYQCVPTMGKKGIYFALEMGSMNGKSRMIKVRFCT